MLGKVGSGADCFWLALEIQAYWPGLQPIEIILAQQAALDHLPQYHVAPLQRALGIKHWVVVARAFQHGDQRCAFKESQFSGGFIEVRARSHFDAESVV